MKGNKEDSDPLSRTGYRHLKQAAVRALKGPLGPFLISAVVVLGFGLSDWLTKPTMIRPKQGASLACGLHSVVDGDTLDVVCGKGHMRVRLWGLDAPEMPQSPWGEQARGELVRLASSGKLTVHVMDHDVYGRVVGRVVSASGEIGLELVRNGFAPVPVRYVSDARYRGANDAARKERRGVWAVPGRSSDPGSGASSIHVRASHYLDYSGTHR